MKFDVLLALTTLMAGCYFRCQASQDAKVVTIAAAYSSRPNFLYLIANDDDVMILRDRTEYQTNRGNFNAVAKLPPNLNMNLRAAVTTLHTYGTSFYGDSFGYFKDYDNGSKSRRLRYGPWRWFIRKGGPDAVARRNGAYLFFKGCQMASRFLNVWSETSMNVSDIGLPCDVDAAWMETDGSTVFLKYNQIWVWHLNGTVEGPDPFSKAYTINSWILDNPHHKQALS